MGTDLLLLLCFLVGLLQRLVDLGAAQMHFGFCNEEQSLLER